MRIIIIITIIIIIIIISSSSSSSSSGSSSSSSSILLKSYSPVNRTGSPQGVSLVQILHKPNNRYITKHLAYTTTNMKHVYKNKKKLKIVLQ